MIFFNFPPDFPLSMDAEVVCQEYSSSLEDLTFNSKPLINMLTMLAEENNQHAAEIIQLIEKRIYEVTVDKKLPALYLMDSIVKNIGKEYITAVAPSVVALFTHVFGKGDEKVRLSLYKLRNTWPAYFGAKKLHEIDCSIHKLDPGWPVVDPPPASPSIHINPKFLPKVEENVESQERSSNEVKLVEDFQGKKEELKKLQGEQMKLQLLQLEELQLKHDLMKKKQEQERQVLIKQQQERILQMRLQQENIIEDKPVDTQTSETSAEAIRQDPRLKKMEGSVGSEATVIVENTGNKADVIKEKNIASKKSEVVEPSVQKVGFDTEFVPLDKSCDDVEPAQSAYNRDRPLGKKRYFTDDSSDKKNTDTELTSTSVTEPKHARTLENSRGKNKRSKIQRGVVAQHREKARDPSTTPFPREHAEENRKNFRREQDGESKGKGRERDSRKTIGAGRRDNETDKRVQRPRIREINEEFPDGSAQAKFPRRDDWNRGRGHKRSRRGQLPGHRAQAKRHGRHRHEFPPPIDNTNRSLERPPRNWSPDPSKPFEHGAIEEPLVNNARPSSPRPLFSEREITEIRERRHGSPPRGFPHSPPRDYEFRQNPDWRVQEPGLEPRFHEPWRHEGPHFEQPFHGGVPMRLPRFPHPDAMPLPPHEGFQPGHIPPEFHRHFFAGGVEIPLELTLDNESEILRSAQRRLSMGDLSEEQHNELLEKLQQLYELQKWQRRHSIGTLPEHEPELPLPPQLQLHPPGGPPPHVREPETTNDNQGFNDHPIQNMVFGDPLPGVFDHQLATETSIGGEEREIPQGELRVMDNQNAPSDIEPHVVKDEPESGPPSNLIMEKQTVDDLFKRLMSFGIITKVNEVASEPAERPATPPVSLETTIIPVPEITLTLDNLRRRYDEVILRLYRGTQCSSCGLRFKEADNTNYRQHLDWHFRVNRKEKETAAAHRNWFITIDDWLDFESSEDPKLKARSSVFEADSDVESENSEEDAATSCPVLREDTESETACDICLEKFEQFWDETSEEWHYKSAVRINGKTYHYLCYEDAEEDENMDDENMDDENMDDENMDDDVEVTNGDNENEDKDDEDKDDEDKEIEVNENEVKENEDKRDSVDSETQKVEEESRTDDDDTKDTCSDNDKTSDVTESFGSAVGGEQGISDANKEEKKPECS